MLEQSKGSGNLDINCCDPLGRTALLMAIDNENLEIIEMLIDNKVSYSLIFNIFAHNVSIWWEVDLTFYHFDV